jgi:hypothetical protein
MHLHPWNAREIHIHIPEDVRQWCVDDGEGDPIPCGAGDAAEERARLLAEMLNLGFAASAKGRTSNLVMDNAKAIYAVCDDIIMLIRTISPPSTKVPDQDLVTLLSEINKLQNLSMEMQKNLLE